MKLETAISKYYNFIFSFVYGKTGKNREFTDECCNTVFFLFSLKENKIADPAVYPWLLKTADNKVKEYFRKIKSEKSRLSLDSLPPLESYNVDMSDLIVSDADIEEAKEKLLSLLSDEERRMYEDYFLNKLSYVEIAQKMGIDRNTASKRVGIIREKLEAEARKMFSVAGAVTVLRIISALFDR